MYSIFLRWWLFAILIVVGGVFGWNLNLFHNIWENDTTKISFLIMGIFLFHSLWAGAQSLSLSRQLKNKVFTDKLRKSKRHIEIGWFASDMCLNLGMIGTIWGFILMLAGFVNVDVSNIKSVQGLLTSMSGGMSIALYTTLTGLVCSQLLKVQFFNLENAVTSCYNFPEGDSQDVVDARAALIQAESVMTHAEKAKNEASTAKNKAMTSLQQIEEQDG